MSPKPSTIASPRSSVSTPPTARPSRPWLATAPTIVAETLRSLPKAPLPLRAGPVCSPAAVAIALAGAARPASARDAAPSWLLDEQVSSFRRALAALRAFGGALLADPPGSGKTYVALAVAARWSDDPPTCLVPAALAGQWRATARRLSLGVQVVTHQAASRGRLPLPTGLVIVDESHHLRNASIRRYGHVARWLVGHAALLVSATPAVNRLDDVVHQLALVLRDDALALHGISSLRELRGSAAPAGLASVIIAGGHDTDAVPARVERVVRHRLPGAMAPLLAHIDALALSTAAPVATLVRGVLWRAAASSPAALAGTVGRYRNLLLQAHDAYLAGRAPGRDALRRWAGAIPEQLVFWPLVSDDADGELDLADLPAVERLHTAARRVAASHRDDAKVARLRPLLADGRRTIVFASARETVTDLRDRLAGAAWCTGSAAGIGRMRLPRDVVLRCFGPSADAPDGPRVLIATDVAAEGLDLHGASRVIHYDLPWTAMRLDQRAGRAARRGARHAAVDVIRMLPPPEIEQRLGLLRAIDAKAALPARIGIGPAEPLRAWRSFLDATARRGEGTRGVAWMQAAARGLGGIVAGVELSAADQEGGDAASASTTIYWVPDRGEPTDDPVAVAGALAAALEVGPVADPGRASVERALGVLDAPVRRLLRAACGARWSTAASPALRHVVRRLVGIGRAAARRRDGPLLAAADRALSGLGGGLTAGELLLLESLANMDDAALVAGLGALPARKAVGAIEARVVGIIIVES